MERKARKRRSDALSYEEIKARIYAKDEAIQKRKDDKRQQQIIDQHVKTSLKRTEIVKRLIGKSIDVDIMMNHIMNVFSETDSNPTPGSYCTFIYNAKTPKLLYDQYPLIAVLSIESWGFKGINFHWGTQRNYTWGEVNSLYHIINNDEISELRKIPYAKFLRVP